MPRAPEMGRQRIDLGPASCLGCARVGHGWEKADRNNAPVVTGAVDREGQTFTALEPDHRPPQVDTSKVAEIDWDNLQARYEAPGARDAVPDMPPIPDVTTPPPKDNWAWRHDDWAWKDPIEQLPPPNTEVVTEENPLEIDVFYSMRSPYSYLSLFRYAYLHSTYNVDVHIRVIFPVAARTRHKSGHAGSGRWYFYGYSVMDMPRTGLYEGIPFRYANPDPRNRRAFPR